MICDLANWYEEEANRRRVGINIDQGALDRDLRRRLAERGVFFPEFIAVEFERVMQVVSKARRPPCPASQPTGRSHGPPTPTIFACRWRRSVGRRPTMPDDPMDNVIPLPPPSSFEDDERLRRVKAEAESLANQSEVERSFFLPKRAEEIGVSDKALKSAVTAVLHETAAERLEQDRERKRQQDQRAAEQREIDRIRKEEAHERRRLAKERAQEAERAKKKAEREAERKNKEKAKGFGNISRLPVARHDKELARLAARLGEDIAALRKQFEEFTGVGGGEVSTEKTEPGPDPVNTAELLQECSNKISRYVVLQEHLLTTTVLWTAHTWLYDHDVPTHSTYWRRLRLNQIAEKAEPDSGKTTLVGAAGRMSPRLSLNTETTGPSLYRFVDKVKPTLVLDEADDLFARKSDLKHIVNAGWTRGWKIPRQVSIGGVWRTVDFDPFTPCRRELETAGKVEEFTVVEASRYNRLRLLQRCRIVGGPARELAPNDSELAGDRRAGGRVVAGEGEGGSGARRRSLWWAAICRRQPARTKLAEIRAQPRVGGQHYGLDQRDEEEEGGNFQSAAGMCTKLPDHPGRCFMPRRSLGCRSRSGRRSSNPSPQATSSRRMRSTRGLIASSSLCLCGSRPTGKPLKSSPSTFSMTSGVARRVTTLRTARCSAG